MLVQKQLVLQSGPFLCCWSICLQVGVGDEACTLAVAKVALYGAFCVLQASLQYVELSSLRPEQGIVHDGFMLKSILSHRWQIMKVIANFIASRHMTFLRL